MWDIISDSLLDTVKLIPFLFLTYLAMEWLEEKTSDKLNKAVSKASRQGPIIGALCGLVPSCGFASAASNFYSGGIIDAGTLLAVFLATSDEMLPLMISQHVAVSAILIILGIKAAIGIGGGYVVKAFTKKDQVKPHIDDLCTSEDCHCEEGSIFKSALIHTLHISLFVLVMTLMLNAALELMDASRLSALFQQPYIGLPLAALLGLIPNCGSSVVLTQLWIDQIISLPVMITGLSVNAGVGLLVLFRTVGKQRQAMAITGWLVGISLVAGLLLQLLNIAL